MDILSDPTLLKVETTADTDAAEEGISALFRKMSSQSEETANYLKELGTALKDLVQTVVDKGKTTEEALGRATDSVKKQQLTIQEQMAKLGQETAAQLANIDKVYEEHGLKFGGTLEQMAAKLEKAIRDTREKASLKAITGEEAKAYITEFEADLEEVRKRIESQKEKKGLGTYLGEKTGLGEGSLAAGAEAVITPVTSQIAAMAGPAGIVGLLLYGLSSAEIMRSQAATVAQSFRSEIDQTGQAVLGARDTVGSLSTALQDTANALHITNEELSNAYVTLGNAGVKLEEAGATSAQLNAAMDDMGITAEGLTKNLGVLTIAVDKAFNLQAGTTAKEAVQVSRDLGITVQHAAEQMYHLRDAARESGENMDRYVSSVMMASKGLAQYGVDLAETTALMQAFTEQDKTSHGAMAAQAIQGVGAFFSNLQSNAGLSAFLAERVVQQEGGLGGYQPGRGHPIDALKAREAMLSEMGQEGGAGGKVLGDILAEMKKTGGGEFGIEKMYGVNFATAEMISKLTPEQITGIKEGKAVKGLNDDDVRKLKEGFMTSEEREDSYKQFLKNALNAFKELLQGILHAVIGMGQILSGDFAKGSANVGVAMDQAQKAWGLLKSGTKQLGGAAEETFEGMTAEKEKQFYEKHPIISALTLKDKEYASQTAYGMAKLGMGPEAPQIPQSPLTPAQLNAAVEAATGGPTGSVRAKYDTSSRGIIIPPEAIMTMLHQNSTLGGTQ